jgi:hypothetical protein
MGTFMESNVCTRCGDFAALAPYGRVAWCEACRRAAAIDLTPAPNLRGFRGIRQTLTLARRLGALRFAPWLYLGIAVLGSVALFRLTSLSTGIASVSSAALQCFVHLWASTWLCHCLLAVLETGRHDARAALSSSLASVPMLLVVTLFASAPPIVHQLASGSDEAISTLGILLRGLIMFCCAFVPALAAQGERSALVASYHSTLLVRTAGSRLLFTALSYGIVVGLLTLLVSLLLVELAISYILRSPEYFLWAKRVKLGDLIGGWLLGVLHPLQVTYLLLVSLKLRRTLPV